MRDLEVYSRQHLIIGHHGLQALLHSTLCIIGLDGLGSEIAKNILLAGINDVTLCDPSPTCKVDISTNVSLLVVMM